jgi:hypothetical protein
MIGFIVGLITGVFLGFLISGLCHAVREYVPRKTDRVRGVW